MTADATAHGAHADARTTCTHWFDLAGLAIAQAGAGRDHRRYDMTVPDRGEGGRTTAHLARDGVDLLDWDVDARTVLGPEPYAGQPMGRGFLAWANATLDPDTAEAAIALRRACRISLGRLMDLDDYERASEVGHAMADTCHTFSTDVMESPSASRARRHALRDARSPAAELRSSGCSAPLERATGWACRRRRRRPAWRRDGR